MAQSTDIRYAVPALMVALVVNVTDWCLACVMAYGAAVCTKMTRPVSSQPAVVVAPSGSRQTL